MGKLEFPLKHPAVTPMPVGLRGYAARIRRQGAVAVVRRRLVEARRAVMAGATLAETFTDGTLDGWRVREFLSGVLSASASNWDARRGRTQGERLAVLDRALVELAEVEVSS